MRNLLNKFNPAVNKNVLYFLAGLMWSLVGIMLVLKAFNWLFPKVNTDISGLAGFLFLGTGVILGFIIGIFGFSKIADKNIKRIKFNKGKRCIFGFIAWKSYLLIAFMIGLGVTLRHSPLPKIYLSVVYTGIGVGLFVASFKYFKELL